MRFWWNVSRSPTVFPARLFRGWHHSSRLAGSRWAWAALSRQPSQCATVYPRARYWAHCCTCCTLPMSPSSLPQLVSESISTRMTHNCMATAARLMLWPWQIVSWPPSHESKPGCHPTVWGWTRKKFSLPGSEHRNGCWSVTRSSSEPGHPHSSHLIRSGTWASCWIQSSEWRATSTACVAHVSTSCDVYKQYNIHCHRRHSPVWSTLSYGGRLDYCNSTLFGSAEYLLRRLQSVLNAAARLILRIKKYDHISTAIREQLHWLPIDSRIVFKICLLVRACLTGCAPAYLQEMCIPVSSVAGRRGLRSSSRGDLIIPSFQGRPFRKERTGRWAFSFACPTLWNRLPDDLRELLHKPDSFKRGLNTFLFSHQI